MLRRASASPRSSRRSGDTAARRSTRRRRRATARCRCGRARAPSPRRSTARSTRCTQPSSTSILRWWRGAGHTLQRLRTGNLRRAAPRAATGLQCPAERERAAEQRSSDQASRAAANAALSRLTGRGARSSTTCRPMSSSRPYWTPDGHVVSQLRQVRQRSRCRSRLRGDRRGLRAPA